MMDDQRVNADHDYFIADGIDVAHCLDDAHVLCGRHFCIVCDFNNNLCKYPRL